MVWEERDVRILKPTTQRAFTKKFYGFDVETYSKKNKFQCGAIYSEDGEEWFFTDKRKMIDFMKDNRFRNSWIVASNLQFDFFKTFENEPEASDFQILFPKSSMIYAKTYIYNDKFNVRNKGKQSHRTLFFVDTMNYAGISVEKLGEIIGIPKLECPFPYGYKCKNKKELESMRIYNMNDAKISCLFMVFLRKEFMKLGANLQYTIASSSMSLFRNTFLKEDIFCHRTDIVKEIFLSYYGGRTECFRRGYINKKFFCGDINSMYPAVMRNKFPHPNYIRIKRTSSTQYINKYEGFSDVDIFCPDMKYPLLPFRREDGMLIFPTGYFSGYYSHIELRRALELGYTIKKVRKSIYYTKTMHPFKDFVDTLYALRMKFKAEKNCAEYVVKILLNSLYGKFASRFDSFIEMVAIAQYTSEELNKVLLENSECERFGDYLRFNLGEGTPAVFCIPEWSSYVTAYARIELHKHMLKAKNLIYVDTDSIFCENVVEDSKELGKLKLEYTAEEGRFVRAKFYAIKTLDKEYTKIKGLQKNIKIKGATDSMDRIVRLDYKQFKNILENPKVFYDKFTKWKEGLRKRKKGNDIETGEIVEQFKLLSLEDTKRDWLGVKFKDDKLYESKPIHIEQNGDYSVEFEMPTGQYDESTDDETEIKQEYFDI